MWTDASIWRAMTVTHLAHVELSCRDLEGSREFFRDVLGLHEVGRADGSYLFRCWGDWQSHSFILSRGDAPGAKHLAWGVTDPEELPAIERSLQERGVETWWETDEPHQEPALRFCTSDGFVHELLSNERRTPTSAVTSRLRAQPLPLRGVGIEPRRLDHGHIGTPNFDQMAEIMGALLGFKVREIVFKEDGEPLTYFMSVNSQVHDLAVRRSREPDFHHAAVWLDTREHMMRAAELLVHRGFPPEVGPGQHASTQAFFCHVLEPSGNRVELFGAQYIVYERWDPPEWTTSLKTEMERALGFCPLDLPGHHAPPELVARIGS